MLKFDKILKEKQELSKKLNEQKVLKSFKKVYSLLLEQYNVPKFEKLDTSTKKAFLNELNIYWDKKKGITKKGYKFIKENKSLLTESSTPKQKAKYLKDKVTSVLEQSLNNHKVKDNIYKVLDEMYKQTKSQDIEDVLPAEEITKLIAESMSKAIGKITSEIFYEIAPEEKLNEYKK